MMYALATMIARENGGRGKTREEKKLKEKKRANEW
jgi:hypothetical protein